MDRRPAPLSDGPSISRSKRRLEPPEPKTRCTPLRKPKLADTAWAGQWIARFGSRMGKRPSHGTVMFSARGTGEGKETLVRVHGSQVRLLAGSDLRSQCIVQHIVYIDANYSRYSKAIIWLSRGSVYSIRASHGRSAGNLIFEMTTRQSHLPRGAWLLHTITQPGRGCLLVLGLVHAIPACVPFSPQSPSTQQRPRLALFALA